MVVRTISRDQARRRICSIRWRRSTASYRNYASASEKLRLLRPSTSEDAVGFLNFTGEFSGLVTQAAFTLAMNEVLTSGRAQPIHTFNAETCDHLAAVFGVVLKCRAAAALGSPKSKAPSPLDLWASEAHSCGCPFGSPRIGGVWRLQSSRSGPNGQSPESSHLALQQM